MVDTPLPLVARATVSRDVSRSTYLKILDLRHLGYRVQSAGSGQRGNVLHRIWAPGACQPRAYTTYELDDLWREVYEPKKTLASIVI